MGAVVINIKYILLVLCIIHLICTVNCSQPGTALNSSEPLWKQLEALEHVHTFLKQVQDEIKESRDLLRHIHFDSSFNYSTPIPVTTTPSKWTMQQDLIRYLSPTVSQDMLRTASTTKVADSSNSQNGTTSFIRQPQPRPSDIFFQDTRDYVLPDIGPDYKDIFAPDVERQGDTNKAAMEAATMDLNMLFVTLPSPGEVYEGGVAFHTTKADPHPTLHAKLANDSTGYLSVGFEMFCMLVATKEPGTVKAVLERSEMVIERLERERHDKFLWMEEPMRTVLNSMAASMTPSLLQIDAIQTEARLMMETMKNRRETLSEYVNRILDFADGLIKEKVGEEIFDVLDAFREYPKPDKKGKHRTPDELCAALIEAFSAPFYFETTDRKRLVNAANRAIRERFAHLNIFRRKALRGRKRDEYHARHETSTNRRYEYKQAWYTPRNSRIPVHRTQSSISHRRMRQSSAVYKRDLRRRMSKKELPMRQLKGIINYNMPLQKQPNRDNPFKYMNTQHRPREEGRGPKEEDDRPSERISGREYDETSIKPITNDDTMINRNVFNRNTINDAKVTAAQGVKKAERIQKRFNIVATDVRRRRQRNIMTTHDKDPYNTNHELIQRPTELRRANID